MKFKRIIFISIIILLLLIAINTKINKYIILSKEEIYHNNLPKEFDGYKILQISDLHGEEFGENNSILIEKINEINPDIIMITGDMFSSSHMTNPNMDETTLPAYSLISTLSKSYDIIYSTGNHEEAIDVTFNNPSPELRNRNKNNAYNRYIRNLEDMGVKFIDDNYVQLIKGNERINVYGVYYYTAEQIHHNDYLKKYPLNKEDFNIILCHDPKYFETLSDSGFDLVLSGHIHGGIIRLPFLGGVFSPDIKLFPTYDKGLFEYNGSYLNISGGLDNSRLIRINNPPEINLITLKK